VRAVTLRIHKGKNVNQINALCQRLPREFNRALSV
jgi:hypothetical protein